MTEGERGRSVEDRWPTPAVDCSVLRAELDCIPEAVSTTSTTVRAQGRVGSSALFPQNGFLRSVRNSDIIEK